MKHKWDIYRICALFVLCCGLGALIALESLGCGISLIIATGLLICSELANIAKILNKFKESTNDRP